MISINTETCTLSKDFLNKIDYELESRYKDVVRWAIVETTPEDIKINVSYRLKKED